MIGLVLEGGGAKGAYHAGAYKALQEHGIVPDIVVGTSIGALNGALIAQNDWEIMYNLWNHMSLSKILDIDTHQVKKLQENHFSMDSFRYFAKYLQKSLETDGLDTSKIRNLLDSIIHEEKLRTSRIDFGLVTVSLSEMKPYQLLKQDIPQGQLIDYQMASSNFPIFKRQVIDGKKFIDGGLYDNTPIDLLCKEECSTLYVIRTKGLGINRPFSKKGLNIRTIEPSRDLGGTLDFSEKTCRFNVNMGYYDALKVILPLYGREYYFRPSHNEPLLMEELMQTPPDTVKELAKMLHISPHYSHGRMIFEGILPKLAELLNVPKECTYEEILAITCEEAAKKMNLEHFHIYTLNEMIEQLKENYIPTPTSTLQKWFSSSLGHEIFLRAFKEQVIEKMIFQVIQPQTPSFTEKKEKDSVCLT